MGHYDNSYQHTLLYKSFIYTWVEKLRNIKLDLLPQYS